jgi:hypothetical protein
MHTRLLFHLHFVCALHRSIIFCVRPGCASRACHSITSSLAFAACQPRQIHEQTRAPLCLGRLGTAESRTIDHRYIAIVRLMCVRGLGTSLGCCVIDCQSAIKVLLVLHRED